MNEPVTVWQDIQPFFDWLWAWLRPTLLWLAEVAPGLALIGAVWAYFNTRRRDRDDEARKVRSELYRQHLSNLSTIGPGGEGNPFSGAIYTHELIILSAPDEVVLASKALLEWRAVNFWGTLDEQAPRGFEAALRLMEATKKWSELKDRLIQTMRQDILSGTSIQVDLKDLRSMAGKEH